jgi:hypothetical protein
MKNTNQLPRNFSGTILTDLVEINSGPYAGMTGRLELRATSDRYLDRGTVRLDQPFHVEAESAWIGDTLHVGLSDARTIRTVAVGLSEYRQLTEGEMLRASWGDEAYDAALQAVQA